jgi:hypothetical protein
MQTAIIAIIQALISGVPKLIEAIKAGRDPKDVKLGEFISNDALETIRSANKRADDFING